MKQILTRLMNNEELTAAETKQIMLNITKEAYNDVQISAMLTCLQMRGVTVEELIGFREALMETRIPIDLSDYRPIDIVGTGGDGKNTFNISTCACFVVAGAGYKVAKHGNYGASSVSGASNVLEHFGVKFSNDQSRLRQSIESCNMTYMHAQLFNPAMKFVGPTRRALQLPTVFNLLGPLINPCKPTYQLLGVADLNLMRLYTNTLNRLGIDFAVVTSLDGFDEISLTNDFKVMTNKRELIYRTNDLGFKMAGINELSGGKTKEEAAQIFANVMQGEATEAQTNAVIINAAFAIHVIKPDTPIEDCVAEARESLESKKALTAFRKYLEINS